MSTQRVSYDVTPAEAAAWQAFVTAWWERFRDEEVSAEALFPIARGVAGLGLGGGWWHSRTSRFGELLGQRRRCVIAGYRVTPNRTRRCTQMWRLLPVERLHEDAAGRAVAVAPMAAFVPSAEWQEIPDGYPCPPGGEYRLDFATGKNWARWPARDEARA